MATLSSILASLDRRIPGVADRITMIDAINIALSEVGKVTKVDENLVVEPNQHQYVLPEGVRNVVRVQIAVDKSEQLFYTDYSWQELEGSLYFRNDLGYSPGNKIRIFYNDAHDSVSEDDDEIDDCIPESLLCAIAAYRYALLDYQSQQNLGVKDKDILQMMLSEMQSAKATYRVQRMSKDPRLGALK
jgi:hypothetical protein